MDFHRENPREEIRCFVLGEKDDKTDPKDRDFHDFRFQIVTIHSIPSWLFVCVQSSATKHAAPNKKSREETDELTINQQQRLYYKYCRLSDKGWRSS